MDPFPPVAKRLLWIGPWRAEDPWASVRSSMFSALRRHGWVVSTVIIGQPGAWALGGVDEVFYLRAVRSRLDSARYLYELSRTVLGSRCDVVVFGHMSPHLAAAAWIANHLSHRRRTVAIDVRTLPTPTSERVEVDRTRERLFWAKMRFGMAFADGWMAISEGARRVVEDRVGARARKLPQAVWASGVDARFLESDDVMPWPAITGKGHPCNVLYLGSMGKGRCLDLAIRAMRLLGRGREVGLHFVGEGDARESLRALVSELGLQDTVHIHPLVAYSDTVSVIKACDIGILPLPDCPAWSTSSPLKLFEYMAQRKPVLVSSIAAHTGILQGQPFAFFMDEYAPMGFCRALERFLELAPAERRRRGDAAREFVRQGHTYDHRARTISDFLVGLALRSRA